MLRHTWVEMIEGTDGKEQQQAEREVISLA